MIHTQVLPVGLIEDLLPINLPLVVLDHVADSGLLREQKL